MTQRGLNRLRRQVRERLDADGSLRVVAARIGVSHITLWKFLHGQAIRPATAAAIQEWLHAPGEADAAQELRKVLRRVLGQLPRRERGQVERDFAEAMLRAFERSGATAPAWVTRMRRKG